VTVEVSRLGLNELISESAFSNNEVPKMLNEMLTRRCVLACLGSMAQTSWRMALAETEYASRYRLSFRNSIKSLEAGFDAAPWNDPHLQSDAPYRDWYSQRRRSPWGPAARQYPSSVSRARNRAWLQERVIRVASNHIGLLYEHHHIPARDPPAEWPWLRVAAGYNAPGLDCSNFSSFIYNYGLGVKLPTGIRLQAEATLLPGPGATGRLKRRCWRRADMTRS
jgi:hypothetical protein